MDPVLDLDSIAIGFTPVTAYNAYRSSMSESGVLIEETWDHLTEVERSAWNAVCKAFIASTKDQIRFAWGELRRQSGR